MPHIYTNNSIQTINIPVFALYLYDQKVGTFDHITSKQDLKTFYFP